MYVYLCTYVQPYIQTLSTYLLYGKFCHVRVVVVVLFRDLKNAFIHLFSRLAPSLEIKHSPQNADKMNQSQADSHPADDDDRVVIMCTLQLPRWGNEFGRYSCTAVSRKQLLALTCLEFAPIKKTSRNFTVSLPK